jgi:hypothetical protein
LSEQPEHAGGEALGLAQGEVEDEPQRQHQLDGHVRVPGLAAGRGPARGLPSGQGGLVQPERQVAAPPQPGLVLAPVPDPVAGLRDAVAAGGVVLERHARERNSPAPGGLPGPGPGGSLHQRPFEPRA